MQIWIEAEIFPVKNGVLARGASIGLAAVGATDDLALGSLQRTVVGWCRGLEREGVLEDALERRGIAWETAGGELSVQVRRETGVRTLP